MAPRLFSLPLPFARSLLFLFIPLRLLSFARSLLFPFVPPRLLPFARSLLLPFVLLRLLLSALLRLLLRPLVVLDCDGHLPRHRRSRCVLSPRI